MLQNIVFSSIMTLQLENYTGSHIHEQSHPSVFTGPIAEVHQGGRHTGET